MKYRSIQYYFKEAFSNLFKNRIMTLASLATVFSCMIIIVLTFSIATNLGYIITQFQENITLEIYFDDELTDQDISNLYDDVMSIEHVTEIYYVSHEEALQIFEGYVGIESGDDSGLSENMSAEVFPRSFRITVDDPENIQYVYDELSTMTDKGFVMQDMYNALDVINTINNFITIISIVIVAFLVVNSGVIIFNTIKLTVNSRRNEISIMKYVGATDWFIRWPFIIEGVLIGIIGTIMALVLGLLSYSKIISIINLYLYKIVDFRTTQFVFLFLTPFCLVLGILIGVIGSLNAVRKYLDV